MSTFGKAIEVSLFGESHGSAIGITIHGLKAGIKLDLNTINSALTRRRPKSEHSTARREKDEYEIISGFFNGYTTGSPLTFIIPNKDTRSKDYNPELLRPSHSDFTSHMKYEGYQDYRGGGHFSGRITGPIVILGSICSQILAQIGVETGSHIYSIKDVYDEKFSTFEPTREILSSLSQSEFPLLDGSKESVMKEVIMNAKSQKDSVGGIIETAIIGYPIGIGGPYFESFESLLSSLLFSIPTVKGVEFGRGFDITTMYGSEANDPFYLDGEHIKTKTNNSGGIQGGITNGMPITFKVAIKPTSSIGKPQNTVNIKEMKEVTLELEGRHDPCIVHRVIHVINAITAYALLEALARKDGLSWIK